MNACHNSAKASAKIWLCQWCLDTLLIKGFVKTALRERDEGSIPFTRSTSNSLANKRFIEF